jgi:hypothetical protein
MTDSHVTLCMHSTVHTVYHLAVLILTVLVSAGRGCRCRYGTPLYILKQMLRNRYVLGSVCDRGSVGPFITLQLHGSHILRCSFPDLSRRHACLHDVARTLKHVVTLLFRKSTVRTNSILVQYVYSICSDLSYLRRSPTPSICCNYQETVFIRPSIKI